MPLEIDPEIQQYIDNHLTHQIHTSERRAWRACRRRWNWVYRDMYQPLTTPEPLEFGVAFHAAMEMFYEPRTWNSPLEIRTDLALVAFRRECDKQLKRYRKLEQDPDVTVLESYKERLNLGLNMIRYYCNNMSPHYDKRWTPVRVEVSFEVPIKDPINQEQLWCKCDSCWSRWWNHSETKSQYEHWLGLVNNSVWQNGDKAIQHWREVYFGKGLPVTYGGRFDALFQDEHGRFWIADWKTTTRLLDEDAESSFLQLDDQITAYLWALAQYGISCAGFVYVEIKKTFPEPPERLTRSYKGRAFSTNKQAMTTYEQAIKVFQTDIGAWQMGLYNEYLDWLKSDGPKFTQRHQIHKNQNEIDNAGIAIANEALDMIGNPRVYPMPGRFSCNWCSFKQPCLGQNMGEDYQYTLSTMFEKKTLLYWQEKQASTD